MTNSILKEKKFYIHRGIDLEIVSYTDRVFATKTEAMQDLRNEVISQSYSDLIIQFKVTSAIDVSIEVLQEAIDRINVFEEEVAGGEDEISIYSPAIVYKR